eukprot:2268652-Prymnesium_polylepis.1
MPFRVCSSARQRPLHTRLHFLRLRRTQRSSAARERKTIVRQNDFSSDLSHLPCGESGTHRRHPRTPTQGQLHPKYGLGPI